MILKNILILTLVITSGWGYAQKDALNSITERELKAHMDFIASDMLQGRDFHTETPGLDITAEYLRAQCIEMGLKDGAENYFQGIEFISIKPDPENTFVEIGDENGNTELKSNSVFSIIRNGELETVKSEVVFAGFGFKDDRLGYNDFEGVDLKGKIALIMTGTPSIGEKRNGGSSYSVEMRKRSELTRAGALAVLVIPNPLDPDVSTINWYRDYASKGVVRLEGSESRRRSRMLNVYGNEEIANHLLSATGKTIKDLQSKINEEGKPQSFSIEGKSLTMQLGKKTETIASKNVIGIIEGSDPLLKEECIVLSAHYDHVGTSNEGIYNGADDNASGTVALLELAEAFMSAKKRPKRSIVFAWVTAEEKGLYGSEYYSQNPTFPLEKTLANINLDMVGRSTDKELGDEFSETESLVGPMGIHIITGRQSSELMEISDQVCKQMGLIPRNELTGPFLRRSDYYHFYKNEIPVIGVTTGLHPDYHQVTDTAEKIDFTKMKQVADYCFQVAYEVANRKERIVVDSPGGN